MNDERKNISAAEADKLMASGEYVHTFTQGNRPGGLLFGCDVKREELLKLAANGFMELSGEQATALKHGLCAWETDHWLFVATKEATP